MGEHIRITEVSLRDGLQNEPGVIPTAEKVRLVRLLIECGFDEIEVSSFVSPKWVPQLADAAEVFEGLADVFRRAGDEREKLPLLSALVPNEKGLNSALAVNQAAGFGLIGKVSVFTAASETFSRKNTNASIAETIERFGAVVAGAHERGLVVRGYVSCAIACPFEGVVEPGAVARVAERLVGIGVDEIDVGDTIGHGVPETVGAMIEAVLRALGDEWRRKVTLHLHDTRMRAADCVRRALELGIVSFDGSAAGLGGCPYASTPGKRAPGNIATETLVRTVEDAGYRTRVDRQSLSDAAGFARQIVQGARLGSRDEGTDVVEL